MKEFNTGDQQILGATVQNLVARTARRRGFVHLYYNSVYIEELRKTKNNIRTDGL
jgi:hypothetical protein